MQTQPISFKEKVLQALSALPANMVAEDAIEQILLIEKIEAGLKAMREGKSISNAEAKERVLNQWQK
jgi:hypothetical protein